MVSQLKLTRQKRDHFLAAADKLQNDLDKQHEEIAKTAMVIITERTKASVLQSLDRAYELAVAFVDKYGTDDFQWIQKDWESTIAEFVKDKI